MQKEFDKLNLHQRMELLIKEMVEKELPFREALREFKKIYIETALIEYKGNKTKIAKTLGIHRNTLHNLKKSLKIK